MVDIQKRLAKMAVVPESAVKLEQTVAQKIWAEIKPLLKSALELAGKPVDYLKPLENLLAGGADQIKIAELDKKNRRLEEKNDKLETEITILKKQRRVLKRVAGLACRGRVKLAELLEVIKKEEGVDVCALVIEEDK